jgi:sugar phosphate isomerase/epimerase
VPGTDPNEVAANRQKLHPTPSWQFMFPGEGAFDTTGYLQAIGTEHFRSFGIEIFSVELDKLAAVEAGRRAGQALRDVAQSVGLELC